MCKGLDTQGFLDGQLYVCDAIAFSALEGNAGSQGEELVCVSWYVRRGLGLGLLHMHRLLCTSMYTLEIPVRPS